MSIILGSAPPPRSLDSSSTLPHHIRTGRWNAYRAPLNPLLRKTGFVLAWNLSELIRKTNNPLFIKTQSEIQRESKLVHIARMLHQQLNGGLTNE
ncbi:MAG: hypothetical protein SP1CHLAM54_00830 [Chlamydiia bacterium]|nr:hypothetical protein [Chlamydiia bacterium]MCH9615005.1 hypothetical protein [Chlamydiia bacterium]MCH9629945.1 hypothetical protein [Chlamydiia bacterium]